MPTFQSLELGDRFRFVKPNPQINIEHAICEKISGLRFKSALREHYMTYPTAVMRAVELVDKNCKDKCRCKIHNK